MVNPPIQPSLDSRGGSPKGGAVATPIIPITFTVEGVPRPKARARRGAGGRWYTPQATKAYEEAVGWAARAAGVHEPCDGGVRLDIVLWMPDRRRRDLDNCAKSICDGLNGIAYLDDSQVAELVVKRRIDGQRPRAEITVAAIDRHYEEGRR
jgi:Holliday junction resolvase RusA-like endonuclease